MCWHHGADAAGGEGSTGTGEGSAGDKRRFVAVIDMSDCAPMRGFGALSDMATSRACFAKLEASCGSTEVVGAVGQSSPRQKTER